MQIQLNRDSSYDLFISYADADRAWVEGYLLDVLGDAGIRYLSESAFELGVPRVIEFERAVAQSKRCLLILSPAYLVEGFTQFPELLAQSYGLETSTWPVIPLILHPVELPPRLKMLTALDATNVDGWDRTIQRLITSLQFRLPGPSTRPECPYPGMVPFAESDRDLFFGRERPVQEMLERLRLHRFLTVIGPSGSGKSSVVSAGLVPALRKSNLFGPGQWLVLTLRPGELPLASLQDLIGSDLTDPSRAVSAVLQKDPNTTHLLLVIDQFEELFTVAKEGVLEFQQKLMQLARTPNCFVVLTARADFYADLMVSPLWSEIQAHRAEILPLDDEGLKQAIVRPAEAVGVFVEAALVERLVADAAGEPGVLPFVQETLVLLWDRLERRFLPLRAYEALVLTRRAYGTLDTGERTGLQVAMARRADAALANLSPDQQLIAQRIFLRLIQFGVGRADTRRQQTISALRSTRDDPRAFDETLQNLTDSRLLTLSSQENATEKKVDIAHESLIRGWPTLQDWVNERRADEETRRRLQDKANEWVRLGRSGGLLDEVELREAENWLSSRDAIDLGYAQDLDALVAASRAEILRVQAEKAQAQQREVEQARKIAETERAARVRQQYFTIGLAVLLIGAIVAAFVAFQQYQVATEQQNIATARELAAGAIAQLPIDPELSLLLAGQAARYARVDQVEQALRQALLLSHVKRVLRGHSGKVYSAVYSSNGDLILTGSDDKTARIWDAASGQLVRELTGHDKGLQSAIFSPDDKQILTTSDDRTARVWDTDTGQLVRVLTGHRDTMWNAAFSPDASRIVTASRDGTSQLWDTRTGQQIATLEHLGGVYSALFSPDGGSLVTASADGTAHVWNAATGESIAVLGDAPASDSVNPVWYAGYSPDSSWVVTAHEDGNARVWDAQTGTLLTVLAGHSGRVHMSVFSPDGTRIVTTSADGTARIWEPFQQKGLYELRGQEGSLWTAQFSRDGQFVVTSGEDGIARIWDARTGRNAAELRGHQGDVWMASFSPDGRSVATAGQDGTARIWRSATANILANLAAHEGGVHTAIFSADAARILTAGSDGTARVWSRTAGVDPSEYAFSEPLVLSGFTSTLTSALFSPDNKYIALASSEPTAQVWDSSTGAKLFDLAGHTGAITALAFSPDSTLVATASADTNAIIWQVGTGKILQTLKGHSYPVNSIAFSPDSKLLATGGCARINENDQGRCTQGEIRRWQVASGTPVGGPLAGHTADVGRLAFSSDGSLLLSASGDTTARIWDAHTGQPLGELRGHTNRVHSAVFSPDNKFIVTAGEWPDYSANVWDTATGLPLAELRGHAGVVRHVAVSPNNRWVVTASEDGTARAWEAATGQVVDILSGHTNWVNSATFSSDGELIVTASRDGTAKVYLCETCGSFEDLVDLGQRHVTRPLTTKENEIYLHR